MPRLRLMLIGWFVCFLRAVSMFNYRRGVKLFILRHHGRKALTDPETASLNVNRLLLRLGFRKKDKRWNVLYFLASGRRSPDFIPESLYYFEIEPRLNELPMRLTYSDKNMYDKWYSHIPDVHLPVCVLRNINGFLYNQRYEHVNNQAAKALLAEGKYIIKPSLDSGGGKNVRVLDVGKRQVDGRPEIHVTLQDVDGLAGWEDIDAYYGRDYVVQRYIRQHEYFGRLCSTAVNTMRLMTYRSIVDDRVHVIQRIMKIGRKGRVTDNEWTGSVTVGVSAAGKLNGYAVDKFGVRFTAFNDVDVSHLADNPFVPMVDRAAISLAGMVHYSRLLGMDFAVDETGDVIFIEMNHSYNGINYFQYNNGPLFHEYTDEILDHCLGQGRKHYVYY
jgi:hypothetical protein